MSTAVAEPQKEVRSLVLVTEHSYRNTADYILTPLGDEGAAAEVDWNTFHEAVAAADPLLSRESGDLRDSIEQLVEQHRLPVVVYLDCIEDFNPRLIAAPDWPGIRLEWNYCGKDFFGHTPKILRAVTMPPGEYWK